MTKLHKGGFFLLILAVLDVLIYNAGYFLAFQIRDKYKLLSVFELEQHNIQAFLDLLPWTTLYALIIFYMFELYSDWKRRSLSNLFFSVGLSVTIVTIINLALSFWFRSFALPRSVIVIAFTCQIVLTLLIRLIVWYITKRFSGSKQVLIIDNSIENGKLLANKLLHHSKGWFIIKDFFALQPEHTEEADHQMSALEDRISSIDIVLLGTDLSREDKSRIMGLCSKVGKEVLVVPELYELFLLDARPQQIDDMLVLSIEPPKLKGHHSLIKRSLDILVSFTLLIVLMPVMLVLMIAIPLTSKGPAIYKQERLGRNERPFHILKFRSMYIDAESKTGPVLAKDKDPRITGIGNFIRMTRLDEIPQLLNVLKGDMSLVGPRPERRFFIEQFKESVPNYEYRMSVKPGITGLAQVMAKYSTTVEDKLRFDLMYVKNYSVAVDVKIIFQTIRVVLTREQSKGVDTQDNKEEDTLSKIFGHSEVAATK
jgi:exopolysaccharide biosynthesis polyprenyl glycosylphosphotransferase